MSGSNGWTSRGDGAAFVDPGYARVLAVGGRLRVVAGCDTARDHDAARWTGPADTVDRSALARCAGPTLDVGCGPGRVVGALARRGVPALGIDVAPVAVRLARRSGGAALLRSVFDRVPGEERWRHLLLLDGNVGIGGAPDALLARARELLVAGGEAVVEADAEDHVDARGTARLEDLAGVAGPAQPWAVVGREALDDYARRAGLTLTAGWTVQGRSFAAYRAAALPRPASAP